MGHNELPSDQAVHSDFLIHWTGKDFETREWWKASKKAWGTNDVEDQAYLTRLRNILRYGLWMTSEGEDHIARVGGREIRIPSAPRCCFTELKLSESRRHAINYGRLGIGFKRPFVFQRLGRPLAYFGFSDQTNDPLLEACERDLKDQTLLNFFKPMNSNSSELVYDLYGESEWRILFFEQLLRSKPAKIVDPRDPTNEAHHAYFKSLGEEEQATLRYLIPLDGWFAMVIYPSLSVKNLAQWDRGADGTFELITRIKSSVDHGNRVEGTQKKGLGNWPIEVDLDACQHF